MLEPPIPSFKTPSSPEYCNAFHLGSLNSFVPQEPKSDHVAPLLFMIRKCCKCLSKTYKTLHDRTAVSLTPPTTAPLSLLMTPPHFLSSNTPSSSASQGLCTSCAFCLQCSSPSFSNGWFLLVIHTQCHLLREASPMTPSKEVSHPATLLHLSALLSS